MHELNSSKHSKKRSFCRNPREPGTNSLELIRFMDLDNFSTKDEKDMVLSPDSDKWKLWMADLISSSQTGLLDEIYFLMQGKIVELSPNGSLKLTKYWYEHVDCTILNEMHTLWGLQKDPDGKFSVSAQVREKLNEIWKRTQRGWVRSDTGVLVHDCEVLEGIRDKFESSYEAVFDGLKGIGRFGI